jgi:anti-sigma B factor antagonist
MIKTEFSDDVVICSFDQINKLNAVNAEEIKAEIGRYFEKPHTKLILDLGNISFIDSSGFGILLSIMKKAKNNSGSFGICCVKPDVMALFRLLQLHNVFSIFNSTEECKKSFGSKV